ncbi:MAG: UDP-glucose/GDP-mannose dehydrogenase family protein, partial [Deltaproteobacteria bacterium]|nr:UDP-glucose/GDP-mannose dehydrogenase family protein [Deltaproteobacteria bacterium]
MKRITIFGAGYVGLVTACALADSGNEVAVVETNPNKLESLKNGVIPIFEPGLADLFKRNLRTGNLSFHAEFKSDDSEIIFICVGTPSLDDGSTDLSSVLSVAQTLGKSDISDQALVVLKSTCPPGTTNRIKGILREFGKKCDVAFNPEFLRQGSALDDTLRPERIVIGVESNRASKILTELFKPFVRNGNPIITTSIITAELVKYVANCYLATRISFVNEVANLCEILGANVQDLKTAVGLDSRIGTKYFYPGCGYGGSCFPKDVKSLIHFADAMGYDFKIAKACDEVNKYQRTVLAKKLIQYYHEINGKIFAVWGLAFKNGTDDVRESIAYYSLRELCGKGARFQAFDPEANEKFRSSYPDVANYIDFFNDQYSALRGSHALLIFTDWNSFKNPDLA